MTHRERLERDLRRAVEDDDMTTAERIAVELSFLVSRDYDRCDRTQRWGIEA